MGKFTGWSVKELGNGPQRVATLGFLIEKPKKKMVRYTDEEGNYICYNPDAIAKFNREVKE